MSFPGDHCLGISKESIEYSDSMHIQGGKLYIINITEHVLTLGQSSAKYGCNLSKSFHARPSVG